MVASEMFGLLIYKSASMHEACPQASGSSFVITSAASLYIKGARESAALSSFQQVEPDSRPFFGFMGAVFQ